MLQRCRVIFIVFALAASAQNEKRDLSQYDTIGPYNILAFASTTESEHKDGEIRDFLWTHWSQHKRGTVVVTHRYVDATIRSKYFIEPDKDGRWGIVEYIDFPGRQFRSKTFSCSEFERVEPNRLHTPPIPIPDSEQRSPEAYLLHPLCRRGKNPTLW